MREDAEKGWKTPPFVGIVSVVRACVDPVPEPNIARIQMLG